MTRPNRYRPFAGFASLDALFSVVPVAMMLFFAMNAGASIGKQAGERMERQQAFDRLVSVADYTVGSGAVLRNGSVRYPNRVDVAAISEAYVEDLRARAGLRELRVSVGEPDGAGAGFCIRRLAVAGGDMRIVSVFVCGR